MIVNLVVVSVCLFHNMIGGNVALMDPKYYYDAQTSLENMRQNICLPESLRNDGQLVIGARAGFVTA